MEMKKLSSVIIDVFDDVNLGDTLKKIASRLPLDVKSKPLPTIEDRNLYDDTQFALTIFTKEAQKLNKFPINSRVNTALSNEYFDLTHHKLPAEAQKTAATYIKLACERYGLNPSHSVKTAAEKFPIMTNIYFENGKDKPAGKLMAKQAEKAESRYFHALVKEGIDGSITRKYAMPDKTHVEKAVEYFDKYASQFKPEDRHQYAHNVVKRSVELGLDISSPGIKKYAGLGYGNDMGDHISIRKKLLEDHPQYTTALDKLASYQDSTDPITFAKVLHELDKKAGLDKYYDKYLADPYLSTFGSSLSKTASYVYDEDGIYLTDNDIEKVARDKYATLKNYFGSTLADGLKKEGASAFVALPKDAKDIIARIANGEIQ